MEFRLKTGEALTLGPPTVQDGKALIPVMRQMDAESPF